MYQTHHFPPLWFPGIIEKKRKKKENGFKIRYFLLYQFSTSQLTRAFPIITLTVSLGKNNDTGNKYNSLKQKKNNDQERHISVSDKAGLLPPCF